MKHQLAARCGRIDGFGDALESDVFIGCGANSPSAGLRLSGPVVCLKASSSRKFRIGPGPTFVV